MADWYVRPDTGHNTTRNGTSYATAWGGWGEIAWGSIAAGDTLYVCGAFYLTVGISVGAHGGTPTNRVTISGAYSPARGYIIAAQTGFVFLTSSRANTRITGLYFQNLTSNAIFITDTATNCLYDYNTFVAVLGGQTLISLYAITGEDHSQVYIRNNVFRGVSSTTGGSAINWYPTTGTTSSLTDIYIEDNVFVDISSTSARSVIHFRIQPDADPATKMTRIFVRRNAFTRYTGVGIEINSGFSTFAHSSGLEVSSNIFVNGREGLSGVGGCMALWGFGPEPSMGKPSIFNNTFQDIQGAAGFANVFFGSYEVYGNSGGGLYTSTIDGNGVLFDYGCQYSRAYANKFYDLRGRLGVIHSGVGVMVLDATNCEAFGNYINGCSTGVYYGNVTGLTTGQSSLIYNNTILNCRNNAVYGLSTMDKATNTLQNNIFTAANPQAISFNNQGAAYTGTETNNVFFGFSGTNNHTLDASDSTANPALDNGYPTANTPTGVFIKPQFDGQFNTVWNPPTVGAFEQGRNRLVRS